MYIWRSTKVPERAFFNKFAQLTDWKITHTEGGEGEVLGLGSDRDVPLEPKNPDPILCKTTDD